MTLPEVMQALEAKGSEQTRKIFRRHGARDPFFGVKVADLKVIAKQIKGDQALALELFDTGNADAQYLAGLVADGRRMTAAQLNHWAMTASYGMISNYPVPWVTSEHPDATGLALQWIDSGVEAVAATGWNTLSALAAIRPDDALPIGTFGQLLDRIVKTIRSEPDEVRYTMNGFVIACGTYLAEFAEKAMETARSVGKVEVDMGETNCKVPDAESYILKCRRGKPLAPKRKTVRC